MMTQHQPGTLERQPESDGSADLDLLPDLASFNVDGDRLREECGLFGIYGHRDAAAITALGLHALQHRGENAGSASSRKPSPSAT